MRYAGSADHQRSNRSGIWRRSVALTTPSGMFAWLFIPQQNRAHACRLRSGNIPSRVVADKHGLGRRDVE